MTPRRLGMVLLLGLLPAALNCCTIGTSQASRTLEVRERHLDGAIDVSTRNGSINVIVDPAVTDVQVLARLSCSGSTVAEAEARLAESSVSVARGADHSLVVRPQFAGGERGSDGASLTIRLPSTRSAALATSNGSIRIEGGTGEVLARTSNGSITITAHDGPADLSTTNAGIRVTSLAGSLRALTSNGSIVVEDHAAEAHLVSSNGPVRLALQAADQSTFSISTSNAPVNVSVGPSFAGEVRMTTTNGSIRVHDQAGRIRTSDVRPTRATLIIGDGGQESTVRTSNGSVDFATASSR